MGSRSRTKPLRSHKIPAGALARGQQLMQEQNAATKRLDEWGLDTVAAMDLGDPKEGHQWLVNPAKGTISEAKL